MDRKALVYSGLLLVSLVIVSFLLSRGAIRALTDPADLSLTTPAADTATGDTREFEATLLFPDFEEALVSGVELIVDRTSPNATTTLDIYLPLATSTTSTTLNLATQPVGTGSVYVEWMFVDVVGFEDVPGTLPGSTLPQLCPDLTCGGKFKGVQSGAHIFYHVEWTVPGDQSFVGDYSAILKVHTNVEGGPDILDSNTVTFSVIPSVVFNPDEDVQLNPAGIDVTWVSANEEDGYLEWATSTSALTSTPSMATDDRGALAGRANKRSHRVSITSVPGGSTIHYNIVSGGQTTGPYSVTIPTDALTSVADLITGRVTYQGGAVGRECVVLVRVSRELTGNPTQHSLWINGLTSATTGGYTLDITNIRQDPANSNLQQQKLGIPVGPHQHRLLDYGDREV